MQFVKKLIAKNPLYFAFFFPALFDGAFTLIGQGKSYWLNTTVASDASPAYYFLVASPWFFLIGSVLWFIFWYWIFKKLSESFKLFLMILFIVGHAWGSTSWIWKIAKDNLWYTKSNQLSVMFMWGIVVLYFGLIASLASYCISIYIKSRNK